MESAANQGLDAVREIVSQVVDARPGEAGAQRSRARSEILVHSIPVFARRGIHRTTVQHLLDAAGISRRTFYKYFRNKVDVLENIYSVFVENMILRFQQQVQRSGTLREIIANTINIYFDYHVSMGPVIHLMMEEARQSDSALAPHRQKGQDAAVQILAGEVERLTGRQLEPLVIRTLLWSLENYSLYLLDDGAYSEQELERCKRVMQGIAEAVVLDDARPELLEVPTAERR